MLLSCCLLTVWLKMWWAQQDEAAHDRMRAVVASGQLEFVNGGWSMQDETTPIYSDVVDQLTTGHEFIASLFGNTTKVAHGWQIDMFSGYSGATPAMYAQAGFNATVIRWEGTSAMHDVWTANKWYVCTCWNGFFRSCRLRCHREGGSQQTNEQTNNHTG
jgi:hypothetical protein